MDLALDGMNTYHRYEELSRSLEHLGEGLNKST